MTRTLSKSYPDVSSIIAEKKPAQPVLCFNPQKIIDNVTMFKSGFKGVVGWAVKCNPHPEIIKAIIKGGVDQFDVASADEIERITDVAVQIAKKRNNKICSVDKANVLEVSQLWRKTVEKIISNDKNIYLTHLYVDNAAM